VVFLSVKRPVDAKVLKAIQNFGKWLDGYGEASYDHQNSFAGRVGGWAKSLYYTRPLVGTIAVAPMIFSDAIFPSARKLFWHPQRFPIADAHYAMGFIYLFRIFRQKKYYQKALHFLHSLQKTRCRGYDKYCWGYPFNWVTRNGTIPSETPIITTTPYAFEAFQQVYELDKNSKWFEILHSIAEHAITDIKDFEISPGVTTCSYTPFDNGEVINASAYRAFLLASASVLFSDERYWRIAEGNINFVLKHQRGDGSWLYAADSVRDFIDHFHTCFVLKALAKIEQLTGHEGCRRAIERGVDYYVKHLFDEKGLPKPFAKAPRLTFYRRTLYDYAECINLGVLLRGGFPVLDKIASGVLEDLLRRWQKKDGSFYSRELVVGWDKVPMHRYAQSQIFRSLCFWLYSQREKKSEDRSQEPEEKNTGGK
jgi:hypothetical protein